MNEAAWEQLWPGPRHQEYDEAWDRFYARFDFKPTIAADRWPSIAEPAPSVTYGISAAMRDLDRAEPAFGRELLRGLQAATDPTETIYALDWQHPGYRFRPHLEQPPTSVSDWPIPALPNGDYYVFLTEDLSWGVFGHPWEETWCVFGEALVGEVRPPKGFDAPILRRDGLDADDARA